MYLRHFKAGSRCHAQLEKIATKGSLMQRYGVVLQELRLEVLRNNAYLASVSTPQANGESIESNGGHIGQSDTVRGSRADGPSQEQQLEVSNLNLNENRLGVAEGQVLNNQGDQTETAGNIVANPTGGPLGEVDDSLTHLASWGLFDSLVSKTDNVMNSLYADHLMTGHGWYRCSRHDVGWHEYLWIQ